ncbi:MAG: hypothetical protein ACFE8L_00725 [Candidatus Hodarchaeota archaeon]
MNVFSIVILSFFYTYSLILFYIAFLAKSKGEKKAFINNFVNALVLVISLTINMEIHFFLNTPYNEFIVFPFDLLMISFIGIFFPIFSLFMFREKNKNKNRKETDIKPHIQLPLKYDIYRKLTHLVVLGIIFSYFTLGFNINGDKMYFSQNLVIFLVGISLIGLLTAEFIRILNPEIYPLKQVNQILREKELHMRFGPHISMSIGCFSIILLFGLIQPIGPVVICTAMTMAIFGDIASNLIGRLIGKTNIRNTNKTYEGLLAGMAVSFTSGIIILILLRSFYDPSILGFFLIPILGALIIGGIDYLDFEIDDNLTFNFILSTVLFFISFFFL